jgi:cell division GTPase FtsZ
MIRNLKGRDFPMKAKVNAACIAVGNGGRNVLNWFAKQEGMAKYHDYLELIAVDTDARKLDLAEGDDVGVQCIPLVDEEHEAFGTGGDIGKGYAAAEAKREVFDAIAQRLAATKGVLFLVGCLGGGSTGAMPAISKIFKAYDVPILALVAIPSPDEGHLRLQSSYKVLDKLTEAGAWTIVTYNERDDQSGTMRQVFDRINGNSLGPILMVLKHIFQKTGSVVNLDLNDMLAIMHKYLYIGYVFDDASANAKSKKAPLSVGKIVNELTSHSLQDGSDIIGNSRQVLLWFEGDWSAQLINSVTREVGKRMAGQQIGIKRGINEDIDQATSQDKQKWIAMVAATDTNPALLSRQQDFFFNEQVAPLHFNLTTINGEALVEYETLVTNSSWKYSTLLRTVRIPRGLRDKIEAAQKNANLNPEEIQALKIEAQPYINQDQNLSGCVLFFSQKPVANTGRTLLGALRA